MNVRVGLCLCGLRLFGLCLCMCLCDVCVRVCARARVCSQCRYRPTWVCVLAYNYLLQFL